MLNEMQKFKLSAYNMSNCIKKQQQQTAIGSVKHVCTVSANTWECFCQYLNAAGIFLSQCMSWR